MNGVFWDGERLSVWSIFLKEKALENRLRIRQKKKLKATVCYHFQNKVVKNQTPPNTYTTPNYYDPFATIF